MEPTRNRQAEGLMQLARLLLDAVARDDERNAAQRLGATQEQKKEETTPC